MLLFVLAQQLKMAKSSFYLVLSILSLLARRKIADAILFLVLENSVLSLVEKLPRKKDQSHVLAIAAISLIEM